MNLNFLIKAAEKNLRRKCLFNWPVRGFLSAAIIIASKYLHAYLLNGFKVIVSVTKVISM